MSILVIIQLKITDRTRLDMLEQTFHAIRPEGMVELVWDSSPMTMVGALMFDHVGVIAFGCQENARAFFQSPEYHNFTVMREACATAHMQVLHCSAPLEALHARDVSLNQHP